MSKAPKFQVISSKFTRQNGYQDIKSSKKLEYSNAIQLLNSFTPQGASPKLSIRIGSYEDKIGIGYYFMEDDENAILSTILMENNETSSEPLNIPSNENLIENLAKGEHHHIFKKDNSKRSSLLEKFEPNIASMILYSLLAGDNMIIIHPEHSERLKFIKSLIQFIPNTFFKYNRITTECSELDGNENIIGVDQLPKKFRSHKKLYMPLDTIFVDLVELKVMGEGLKNNNLTKEIISKYESNIENGRKKVLEYFTDISKVKFKNYEKYGDNSEQLTQKIRMKLGLKEEKDENWLLSF